MAMSMAVENGRLDAEYHWRRRRRWFAENFNFRDEVMFVSVCVLVGD
ncbi:hypothetical protein NC653_028202 [Populus alba x Populus x berolinensis]|uniref:Uncharacterized protein n=1 Tax=Populus alba x Populus x berolinensis TaxID=444605 RepID=A0AAD6M7E6_9ROSI|nr:hypothetical protein NC653_028202 [Populus alba x Populus x berolinensis]